ncbi:MAG: hypothetical protein EOO48_10380 [Flavobacterium sp.]|nr:MAG: hypothetical protein EOO48_10380 [Flavobacterium sp.]
MIKKSSDTSLSFNMTEEELSHKEIKANFNFDHDIEFINLSGNTSSLILSENLSKHGNVFTSIFIPPPDLA